MSTPTNSPPRPLLLLDVDGVLNPYKLITRKGYLPPKQQRGVEPYAYDKHLLRPKGREGRAALPVLISKEMGEALLELNEVYTLVWATTWEEDANTLLAPLLGIPPLPVLEWPGGAEQSQQWADRPPRHRGSWKVKWIARWVDDFAVYRTPDGSLARIPWVWIDDETNRYDREWLRAHYGIGPRDDFPYPFWCMRTEASHGLRRNDITALREWAQQHTLT